MAAPKIDGKTSIIHAEQKTIMKMPRTPKIYAPLPILTVASILVLLLGCSPGRGDSAAKAANEPSPVDSASYEKFTYALNVSKLGKDAKETAIDGAQLLMNAYFTANGAPPECVRLAFDVLGDTVQVEVDDLPGTRCGNVESGRETYSGTYRVDLYNSEIKIFNSFKENWLSPGSPLDNTWFSLDHERVCRSNAGPAHLIKELISRDIDYSAEDRKDKFGQVVYTHISAPSTSQSHVFYKGILQCASTAILLRFGELEKLDALKRYQ
jgi:hypothetical protein